MNISTKSWSSFSPKQTQVPILEYIIATSIFLAGLCLRVWYIFRFHFDTDEPQHLQVVWSWVRGSIQYRDIFDNHTPLFHLACTPFMRVIGENACALYWMRLVMVLLFIATMFFSYIIAKNLFSRRVALWTVALTGIYPAFFFCSLQFRADILWMALWLAAMAIFMGKRLTPARLFWSSLLLGAALCTSLKTTALLFALLIAAVFALGWRTGKQKHIITHDWPRSFLSILAGFLLIPLILIFFFSHHHALSQLFYCTISHNILPHIGHWNQLWRLIVFAFSLPVVFLLSKTLSFTSDLKTVGIWRAILFAAVVLYFLFLFSFWPIVTRQDFLPLYSLISIMIIPFIVLGASNQGQKRQIRCYPSLIMFSLALIEILVIFLYSPPWRNDTKGLIAQIREVLYLTASNDWVIDQKGETVFRPRPCYFKLESFTRERYSRGLLKDDIVSNLISKRCYVATNSISRFPPETRAFLRDNYLKIGNIRVAGKLLYPGKANPLDYSFHIPIPGQYTLITPAGPVSGALDNRPYHGSCLLGSGYHHFRANRAPEHLAVIWSRAADKGFSPFTHGQSLKKN